MDKETREQTQEVPWLFPAFHGSRFYHYIKIRIWEEDKNITLNKEGQKKHESKIFFKNNIFLFKLGEINETYCISKEH